MIPCKDSTVFCMNTIKRNCITIELTNPPSPSLLCPICRDVFLEPLINQRCHHSFCTACIQKSLEISANCPLCRCQLKVSDLHPNLALASLINEIPVYCVNRDNGCTSPIALELYQCHIERCMYSPKECLHAALGCKFKCLGPDLASHLNSCPFQAIFPFINETNARIKRLEELVKAQAEELEILRNPNGQIQAHVEPEVSSAFPQTSNEAIDQRFPFNEITNQQTLTTHSSGVTSLAYSNELLFSGAHDGTVQIHDTSSMALLWKQPTHTTSVWGLAVAQDEKRFFSASSDGMIKAWDWASEDESGPEGNVRTLDHHTGKVYSLMSRFGKLFSGSSDRTVKIWDPRNLDLCQTLSGHRDSVNCITALRNTRLVSGSSDRSIKVNHTLTFLTFSCGIWVPPNVYRHLMLPIPKF
ncbi:E3 ubiquitin-protein ligase traf7, variant 4 [Entomophthora muscae]|uniref:E3 ubiquitin-protein ligase traf7, variant 4 n=1 Tax=Entomophthora muscae TaxID=34485 RepID=A0ACC2RM61_9FUNG|nr:E3 ubiquitin-protein ligase traf7, variant 4 [Entomophthora muscae]